MSAVCVGLRTMLGPRPWETIEGLHGGQLFPLVMTDGQLAIQHPPGTHVRG